MAVVHEPDDGGSGEGAVVAIFLIALIVILAIVWYGFAMQHWFGFGLAGVQNTTVPGASATSGAPSVSASIGP